jgi:hypothetical protein
VSKIFDKLKGAERERQAKVSEQIEELRSRIAAERISEETVLARGGEERRALDLARER